jgi:beta-lactamase class A
VHRSSLARVTPVTAGVALFALLVLFALPASARQRLHRDAKLERQLSALADSVHGNVGIYVHNLTTGTTAEVNADSVFPTASMIKVPILVTLYDQITKGNVDIHQRLVYTDSLYYPGTDILGSFKDSATIDVSQLVMLMLTMSDNTASLWLQSLAGGGASINQWLEAHGFEHTRMNSRTEGRRGDWERYGWGQTTPREMARLVTMIREGKAVSEAASEEMYRGLTRSFWNAEALAELPPWVQAASKQGAVDQARGEVVLVNAPSGDYVFCVTTNNLADTTWAASNEGWELIRQVSALLWKRFEPKHPWKPDPGAAALKASEE